MPVSISIIIATYKRPHLITRALDSIAAQTIAPDEIIVVDDASGDNTGDVVAAWSKTNGMAVVFIQAPENRGVGAARNMAMRQAKGEYIGFLDSDDAYLPHAVATLLPPLLSHPNAILSFADAVQHGPTCASPIPMMRRCLDKSRDTSSVDPLHPEWRRLNDPQSVLLTTSMIPTCSALFRKDAAEAVGLMPEYRHGEDWIFWLKLTGKGDFIGQFVNTANIYRQGDNQTGAAHDARNAQMNLNAFIALRDGRFGVTLTPENNRRLDTAIAEKTGHMRYHHSRYGLSAYWRMLGSLEAQATGTRLSHIMRDPKSLLRALTSGL
jgi:glycosyltransferase involved in cell wall biosynthesis